MIFLNFHVHQSGIQVHFDHKERFFFLPFIILNKSPISEFVFINSKYLHMHVWYIYFIISNCKILFNMYILHLRTVNMLLGDIWNCFIVIKEITLQKAEMSCAWASICHVTIFEYIFCSCFLWKNYNERHFIWDFSHSVLPHFI